MKETITLNTLQRKYGSNHIPYAELLKAEDWLYKRQHIIARDKHCCKKCGKSGTEWIDGKKCVGRLGSGKRFIRRHKSERIGMDEK